MIRVEHMMQPIPLRTVAAVVLVGVLAVATISIGRWSKIPEPPVGVTPSLEAAVEEDQPTRRLDAALPAKHAAMNGSGVAPRFRLRRAESVEILGTAGSEIPLSAVKRTAEQTRAWYEWLDLVHARIPAAHAQEVAAILEDNCANLMLADGLVADQQVAGGQTEDQMLLYPEAIIENIEGVLAALKEAGLDQDSIVELTSGESGRMYREGCPAFTFPEPAAPLTE